MQLIFGAKEEGGNVLTSAAIREMFQLYDAMENVTVNAEQGGAAMTWQEGICSNSALDTCRCATCHQLWESVMTAAQQHPAAVR